MKKVVFNNITGEFVGYGSIIDYPNQTDLSEKEVADIYLTEVIWDSSFRDFINKVPETESIISTLDFLSRFTIEERTAIRKYNNDDIVVSDILFLMSNSENINLKSTEVISGLNYLEYLGVLSTVRKNTILGV